MDVMDLVTRLLKFLIEVAKLIFTFLQFVGGYVKGITATGNNTEGRNGNRRHYYGRPRNHRRNHNRQNHDAYDGELFWSSLGVETKTICQWILLAFVSWYMSKDFTITMLLFQTLLSWAVWNAGHNYAVGGYYIFRAIVGV